MPVIPATQKAEIRGSQLEVSPRQIVHKTLSQKNKQKNHTKRAVEWLK
jgi:hypothetical protein